MWHSLALLCSPLLAVLLAGMVQAQPAHVTQPTLGCANPRAVRALNDTAEPRRADPGWVNFVVTDGRCVTLTVGTALTKSSQDADLAAVSTQGGAVLFLRNADITLDAGFTAPTATIANASAIPPPASPWQASRPLGGIITCQVDGQASLGNIILAAVADHPGIVRLHLQKSTWRIPVGTAVDMTMAFSEGSTLHLSGVGSGNEVVVDMADAKTVKLWVHGFTAGQTSLVSFNGRAEPTWSIDLHGTSPAITAMAACIKDNDMDVPPPLGLVVMQPFAAAPRDLAPRSTVPVSAPPLSSAEWRTQINEVDGIVVCYFETHTSGELGLQGFVKNVDVVSRNGAWVLTGKTVPLRLSSFLPANGDQSLMAARLGVSERNVSAIVRFDTGFAMQIAGRQSGGVLSLDFAPGQVAPWVHEFTADRVMTVDGQDGFTNSYDLTGSTTAINQVAKCVKDKQIKGLPPPFELQ